MKILVIADIHSNLTAFNAALEDVRQRVTVDEIWNLGDVIGYGPDPHECIQLLKRICKVSVAGNHDLATVGNLETSRSNAGITEILKWTRLQLSFEDKEFLKGLSHIIEKGEFTLVRGSPIDPIWEYVSSIEIAKESLSHLKTPHCMVGHLHVPIVFEFRQNQAGTGRLLVDNASFALKGNRVIFNPGSIGHPRDQNALASYGVFDTRRNRITVHRVSYDVASGQKRMRLQGFQSKFIDRLASGL